MNTPAANLYPALHGLPVTEGHATQCRNHGHAAHLVNGTDSGVCPRCGEVKPPKGLTSLDLSGRNQEARDLALSYFLAIFWGLRHGHLTEDEARQDLRTALSTASVSRKDTWRRACLRMADELSPVSWRTFTHGDLEWYILQHCITYLGYER